MLKEEIARLVRRQLRGETEKPQEGIEPLPHRYRRFETAHRCLGKADSPPRKNGAEEGRAYRRRGIRNETAVQTARCACAADAARTVRAGDGGAGGRLRPNHLQLGSRHVAPKERAACRHRDRPEDGQARGQGTA